MIDPNRLILLGEIGAAHGIRGEVSVRTFTENAEDISAYGVLTDKSGTRIFEIVSLRVTAKSVIARLKGVNDRTAAEALRNTQLFVRREQLPEPEPGTYYHEDLAGLDAFDPAGAALGTVVRVVNFGAGDLIEIAQPGARDTLLVPFSKDTVPEIDLKNGRLVVAVPAFADDDGEAPDAASEAYNEE